MIELSAKANNLTTVAQHSEEYAQLMMEELDTYNGGYIQVFELEKLLRQTASQRSSAGTPTNNGNLSQRLRPTAKPNALLQWYHGASHSLNQQLRMAPYACERMARPLRSSARPVDVLGVAVYPDPASAVSLRFSKPRGFRYRSGQYVFLNCPAVSPSQWRPFYITSAPQDDHVGVHIRTVGGWTHELGNVFSKVCPQPTTEGRSFPEVLMDGPYGAPTQDYEQYDVVLLVGLDVGAAPMVSIVRDIISSSSNMRKRSDGDDGSSNRRSTRRAYFYWVNQLEQASFEWFRGAMDEVVQRDDEGVIELHNYCTSVHEEGDARSTLISVLQSLNHAAKNGVDVVSGPRVKTHFGRPDWRSVYERIAFKHRQQRIGVFYCGTPMLTKELRELAHNFSKKTRTRFEFHNANL
ncbi:respiratory burst oxidase protein D variant beta [Hordeum vulgare]|nr:respiratory burst oxidase protein D variant beta [Hordeum vulgare]